MSAALELQSARYLVRGAVQGVGFRPFVHRLARELGVGGWVKNTPQGVLIAAIDAPYQLWAHARKLKMTRKEIEDELKESEGNPEVRSKVRQMQQEVARRRMLESVPLADVVITNPTHFAVALRYAWPIAERTA